MKSYFDSKVFRLISAGIVTICFSTGALQATAQATKDYSIRWDTATRFDQIPFGEMIRYVFMTVAYAKEHDILTQEELSLINAAEMKNPRPFLSYQVFEQACNWYQNLNPDDDLDGAYAGNLFRLADQYEAEEKIAPYLTAYEQLSTESARFILAEIESYRGTRVMSSSTMKWDELFADNPAIAERAYERLCDRLPQMLKDLENWPDQKSFDNVQSFEIK